MREPRLPDLESDPKGTGKIRRRMMRSRAVKITINIDAESLAILRAESARTGVPYQRLLNQVLKQALKNDSRTESRLDRLERELNRLKRRFAA